MPVEEYQRLFAQNGDSKRPGINKRHDSKTVTSFAISKDIMIIGELLMGNLRIEVQYCG